MKAWFGILIAGAIGTACPVMAATLDIYFIDVEGGQATLVVTPAREALLIDAGWPGEGKWESRAGKVEEARDAQRIAAVARDADVTKIDYLLITHFHRDHLGGVAELEQLLPIGTFIDYGSPVPQDKVAGTVDLLDYYAFDTYEKVRARSRHLVPMPGERLPVKDVETTVVSIDRATLTSALAGAGTANETCKASANDASDPDENPRSIGVLLQFGKFRFLDLGDLSGQPLFDLVCPTDRIGPVDVYLVPHHGHADVAETAILAALKPRAAVINNSSLKGNFPVTNRAIRLGMGDRHVWQLHRSERPGAENVAPENIANLTEETAHWIKISASQDGSFKVLNGRTGLWREYGVR